MTKEYWWVSVGGASCEPAVVCDEGIFTLGCPDAHADGVVLVQRMGTAPPTPAEAAKAAEEWERRRAKAAVFHGYRRFD